ncbi:restriction endonuclease subunit S [Arcobacter arenosus]|uniref:restriction endonuclease subunit S n=1 Tax=Arcobacter arenosus TaxID=2576037 RepID=UPI003BABC6C6
MAWKEVKLEDIAFVTMGQSPKSEFYNENKEGLPFFQGRTEFGEYYPNIKMYTSHITRIAKKNDILFTVRAPVGDMNFSNCECCIGRGLASIRSRNMDEQRFLYYLLKLSVEKILTLSNGTVYDSINSSELKSFKLLIPNKKDNRLKIAKLLSNYDDLIENNSKRIKLLEAMAEEIYKEWFVRLRFPNYQNTKIEDGIPQGWEEKTINKLCEVTSSKRIFSSEYIEKGIPFFRGKEITLKSNNKSIDDILYIKQEKYEEIKKSFGVPKEKDILLTAVGTIGSIYSVKKSDDEFYFKDGNLIWLKNFNNEVEYFIYYFMKSEEIQNKLENISIGSSQKALTIDSIKKITVIVPTNDIIILFNKLIEPILKEIDILQQKNQTLKQTRDLLLPRLLSGKLDIEKLDIN